MNVSKRLAKMIQKVKIMYNFNKLASEQTKQPSIDLHFEEIETNGHLYCFYTHKKTNGLYNERSSQRKNILKNHFTKVKIPTLANIYSTGAASQVQLQAQDSAQNNTQKRAQSKVKPAQLRHTDITVIDLFSHRDNFSRAIPEQVVQQKPRFSLAERFNTLFSRLIT